MSRVDAREGSRRATQTDTDGEPAAFGASGPAPRATAARGGALTRSEVEALPFPPRDRGSDEILRSARAVAASAPVRRRRCSPQRSSPSGRRRRPSTPHRRAATARPTRWSPATRGSGSPRRRASRRARCSVRTTHPTTRSSAPARSSAFRQGRRRRARRRRRHSSTSSTSPSSTSASTSSAGTTCASRNLVPYTVVADDSWFGIAQRNGTSMRALLQANDASRHDDDRPGRRPLPAGGEAERDRLDGGRRPARRPAARRPAARRRTTSSPGRTCATSNAATRTVVRDDSWFSIAQRADVTLAALLDANDAKASTILYEGDVVCLPPPGSGQPVAPGTTRIAGMTALPVQGDCYFIDTWRAPRGAGRRHEGVDLLGKRELVHLRRHGRGAHEPRLGPAGPARRQRVVVEGDRRLRHVLLLCAPLGLRSRAEGRFARQGRTDHRLSRRDGQRCRAASPLRDPPGRRRRDQPLSGGEGARRLQHRSAVPSSPADRTRERIRGRTTSPALPTI